MKPAAILFLAFLTSLATAWASNAGGMTDRLDIHRLPLGDGRVSDVPRRGYVMSCNRRFRGGGAQHSGAWIDGTSWDATAKIAVAGRVMWPTAQLRITTGQASGIDYRMIDGNGLPLNAPTGTFPVARDDPAFRIDRNPNAIAPHKVSLTLPMNPQGAPAPSCVPMGMIAVALDGVAIFNALDDAGRDAVAHEVQDLCDGHPQLAGQYHYHGPSPCMPGAGEKEALVGYALDGFGIYSMYDAAGRELTNTDLDACHGRTSDVMWNGRRVAIYHYVLTREYPYTLGCFKGTPVRAAMECCPPPRRGPPPGGLRPPPPPFGGRPGMGPPRF